MELAWCKHCDGGLIAGASLPAQAGLTPPVKDDGVSSTGDGGDGGGGLGPAKPWLGSLGGINTATGNLFTSVPLFGWTQKARCEELFVNAVTIRVHPLALLTMWHLLPQTPPAGGSSVAPLPGKYLSRLTGTGNPW